MGQCEMEGVNGTMRDGGGQCEMEGVNGTMRDGGG